MADCFKDAFEAIKGAGSKLSKDTLRDIQKEADQIIRQRDAGIPIADIMREVRLAAIAQVKSAKMQKAAAAENFVKVQSHVEKAVTAKKPAKYIAAMNDPIGSDVGPGMKAGVRPIEQGLRVKYLGGTRSRLFELDNTGALERLWHSGRVDAEVARVLWEKSIGNDPKALIGKGLATENSVRIGTVLNEVQWISINDGHKRGIPIAPVDMFVTSTSHDGARIKRQGFDAWFKEFENAFTLRHAATPADFLAVAQNFYNDITANVFSKKTGEAPGRSRAVLTAPERAFIPKSADLWSQYNAAFGRGNIRETYATTMFNRAKDFALVDVWGTTPEVNYRAVINQTLDALRSQPDKRAKLDSKVKSLNNLMDTVTGLLDTPAHDSLAKYMSASRAYTRTTIYGGSLWAQIPDLSTAASELRFQGFDAKGRSSERGFLSGIFELLQGFSISENKAAVHMLEYLPTDYIAAIGEANTGRGGVEGFMLRLQDLFFKVNGQTWWTNRLAAQHEVITASELASLASKNFDKLPSNLQALLASHNIDGAAWGTLRHGTEKAPDGHEMLTTKGIMALPDTMIDAYKTMAGDKRPVAIVREELADKYRNYLVDRAQEGINQPHYRERSLWLQGTQAGTGGGEVARSIGMVKAYPTAVLMRTMAREIHGYGVNNVYKAMVNGQTGYGFAKLITFSTLLGYLSLSARDMLRGKEPRDPLDPRTMAAAMARGGAFGFYGDLIFGAAEKSFTGNAVTALLGPQSSMIADIVDLGVQATKIEHQPTAERLAASALRTAYRNTPGNNLFYVKPVIDYTIMYGILEDLSPGYLRRMEKNVEKNTGAEFWAPPSQRALRP